MKKTVCIIIFVMVAVLCVIAVSVYFSINPLVGTFLLEDYEQETIMFSHDISYGEIPSAAKAIDIAKQLFKENYPDSVYGAPYRVSYDPVNRVWLVNASVAFVIPSGPYLLI